MTCDYRPWFQPYSVYKINGSRDNSMDYDNIMSAVLLCTMIHAQDERRLEGTVHHLCQLLAPTKP